MVCAPLRATLQTRREPTATKAHGRRISQLSFGKLWRKETQQRSQTSSGVTLVTWSGQETTQPLYRWKNSNRTGTFGFWFSDVAFGAWSGRSDVFCSSFRTPCSTQCRVSLLIDSCWDFSVSHPESSLCSSRAKGAECAQLRRSSCV